MVDPRLRSFLRSGSISFPVCAEPRRRRTLGRLGIDVVGRRSFLRRRRGIYRWWRTLLRRRRGILQRRRTVVRRRRGILQWRWTVLRRRRRDHSIELGARSAGLLGAIRLAAVDRAIGTPDRFDAERSSDVFGAVGFTVNPGPRGQDRTVGADSIDAGSADSGQSFRSSPGSPDLGHPRDIRSADDAFDRHEGILGDRSHPADHPQDRDADDEDARRGDPQLSWRNALVANGDDRSLAHFAAKSQLDEPLAVGDSLQEYGGNGGPRPVARYDRPDHDGAVGRCNAPLDGTPGGRDDQPGGEFDGGGASKRRDPDVVGSLRPR